MARKLGSVKILQAYAFLLEAEENHRTFTLVELMAGSGWSESTARGNLGKKLSKLVERVEDGYKASGLKSLTADAFCRTCSQSAALSDDPQKPPLMPRAEGLVVKAREAALAAVQHYNNPTVVFRSGNYIILMMIAFTALFHAIYERDGVDYEEKMSDGSSKKRKDNVILWDVGCSAKYYAETYCSVANRITLKAMAKNLEYFIPLRNKIEHQFMPAFDEILAAECQSMLMNFETILADEFTSYYSLGQSLSLALQFSTHRTPEVVASVRRLYSQEYDALKEYINDFRSGLSDEIVGNSAFAFRVRLTPMPVSEARKSDISIEFIKIDPNNPQQTTELERCYVAIKQSAGIGDPTKDCNFWEAEVVEALRVKFGAMVEFGLESRQLNGAMIRDIIKAHAIPTPSKMYYRPSKGGARAQYGQELIDWIAVEYKKDPQLFSKARIAVSDTRRQ